MSAAVNSSAATICARNVTAHDGALLCYWSGGPDTRGTLNIIWLCLSTLIICVWSAVHPAVPAPSSSRFRCFKIRIGWLLTGLFMPEVLVLIALVELCQAVDLLIEVEKAGVLTEFPWWIRKMPRKRIMKSSAKRTMKIKDKFSLGVRFRASTPVDEESSNSLERGHPWTLTHSFYAIMGGYYGTLSHRQDQPDDSSRCLALGRHSIIALAWDNPASILNVSADDLGDRSKADSLTKLLLSLQLCYFLINCVARRAQELPLTLLEITTISHSLCSLVALLLWLYKPNGVKHVTIIGGATLPKQDGTTLGWITYVIVWPGHRFMTVPRATTIALIAALHGLPHLLGISVQFPSAAEKILWEIATFVVIGLPVAVFVTMCIAQVAQWHSRSRPPSWSADILMQILCVAFVVLSPVCSVFLLAESLRQVFALPEQSFHEAQFTRYLPSFS